MERKCKDCKYWNVGLMPDKRGYADCGAVNYIGEDSKDLKPNFINVELDVNDDSGLSVDFLTHPKFSCSSFELAPKEYKVGYMCGGCEGIGYIEIELHARNSTDAKMRAKMLYGSSDVKLAKE